MKRLLNAAEIQRDLSFEAIVADTDAARRIHYGLRYQVYCLETGFEQPTSFWRHEEKDAYDDDAIHFLIRCLNTGDWVAAARLIVRGARPLPVESHCALDPGRLGDLGLPGGEVSRLLIVRGRALDALEEIDAPGFRARARAAARWHATHYRSEILQRLLIALVTRAREFGIEELAFFLTPALQRIIARMGIHFRVVGEPCEHRGLRYPCVSNVEAGLRALYAHSHTEHLEIGAAYHLFSKWT
jgi:N-acyl amino acid synthase of PEP-CTERM/exosortase system